MHIQQSPMAFTQGSAQKIGPPPAKSEQVNEQLGPPKGPPNGMPLSLMLLYPVYLTSNKQKLKRLYRVFQISRSWP